MQALYELYRSRKEKVLRSWTEVRRILEKEVLTTHDFATKSADGTLVKLRWYEKEAGAKGPAVLYLHGGGMILGSIDTYDSVVRNYVSQSGVPMLSVDYRLAPESRIRCRLKTATRASRTWPTTPLRSGLTRGALR